MHFYKGDIVELKSTGQISSMSIGMYGVVSYQRGEEYMWLLEV